MGSFVDFLVIIPESTGDMKSIFICFDPSSTLLYCFVFSIFFGAMAPIWKFPERNGYHRLC